MRSVFAAGTVTLCTRATEEFRHSLASPEPALSGSEAIGVEMLGEGRALGLCRMTIIAHRNAS